MAVRTKLRTVGGVDNDMLWPEHSLTGPDPEQSMRHAAIAEVLCSIPEDDYRILAKKAGSFHWFIPDDLVLGMNYPFYATVFPDEKPDSLFQEAPYTHLVYLSPMLERRAWDIVVAVVAHELAHIVLDHRLWPAHEDHDAQEKAVFRRICAWGFKAEARKHRALWKRLETREESAVRKLLEQHE